LSWSVQLSSEAERALSAVREPDRSRLLRRLASLKSHARPFGIKKLGAGVFRLRVGDWRVIYAVDNAALVVRVARIVRRNERTYGFL
jgi:mRNA interferase RelE/StbE